MAEPKLYFKYLRNEKNEEVSYKYKGPIYGPSNTDPSYYEPQATRIANMYRSASAASNGVYDFDDGSKAPDINDCVVPVGRKPGLTFEEVSQMQTINERNIKAQAKQAEQELNDSDELSKKNIKEAVAMANAIKNGSAEE